MIKRKVWVRWICWAMAAFLAPHAAFGENDTNAPAPSFIRFVVTGAEQGQLQTSVRTYERADGVRVALLSAVHIADGSYFRKLQGMFEDYDAVLYEMVREEGVDVENLDVGSHPVSQLQLFMRSVLDLEFQLEAIDYGVTNFVHADLDPDTFLRLQEERGESILGLMMKAVLEEQNLRSEEAMNPFQLLFVLLSPDRAHSLKFLLGQQMHHIEQMLGSIDQTPDGKGSVLVSGRNEHALKVLAQQIEQGRRRLGIFYGAGHMPDFHRRLEALGFRSVGEEWLVAWDVRKVEVEPGNTEGAVESQRVAPSSSSEQDRLQEK